MGTVQVHAESPLIALIKMKNYGKLEIYFDKIKLSRDLTSEKLEPYELKTDLFDNRETYEFLLFIQNFNMTLEASGTIKSDAKIQYLCTLVHGEELCQFDTFPSEVGRLEFYSRTS